MKKAVFGLCLTILPVLGFCLIVSAKGVTKMKISSSAFGHEEKIPSRYTCDSQDVSPPLAWEQVPAEAKSLVLICDDPDAPMGTWVHWVFYDIPPSLAGLPEKIAPVERPDIGGVQGKNDFGRPGYGGPCPPSGTHRYFFKLYALDTVLNLPPGRTKKQVLQAMEGHVLAEAVLMGTYSRR